MKRMRSAYARRRGLDYDGPETMRVGADAPPDISQFRTPSAIDPMLAQESTRRLTAFIARGATYGSIDFDGLAGSDGVLRWYAFRYAEHPADQNIPAPHPGVDYLVGPGIAKDPGIAGTGLTVRGGLAAVAIVTVTMLILAKHK